MLSPTYQVPVLYFSSKDFPLNGPEGFDIVYRWLIPPQYRSQLRDVGVMGGLSIGVRVLS